MNKCTIGLLLLLVSCLVQSCSDDDEILMNDVEEIKAYLSTNNITAQEDRSGLFFVIKEDGTGESVDPTDIVEVEYEGRLLDGTVFDGTPDGEVNHFLLSNLVEGWQIGLPKIKTGGEITLYVPSSLGFGAIGTGGIPANSILVFDIKLLDVANTQAEYDERKIEAYIEANNLENVQRDPSGLYYLIEEEGSADKPSNDSEVLVLYQGYLLNGDIFDETLANDARQFSLVGVISGWRIGVPFIGRGGRIKLLIPSALAYGPSVRTGIPANSVLIFDIELKNFQ